ncbi:MAG: TIM barrel protein [Acidobacteriaceae bacterium]|nr:TIM barrel protein [Acidobacteriaceae bacterium]
MTRRHFLTASACVTSLCFAKVGSIRLGCQANAWPLKEGNFDQLLDVVKTIKSLGYVGFECNIRFVRDQFEHATAARKRIEETGMQFIGAHTSMQEASREDFPKFASGAAQLGALYIVMSSSGLAQNGQFPDEALKAKTAQLEDLAKTCRQSAIQLAYHNHTAEFANNNAEIQALADHTDPKLVSFLIDAGHGYQGGGDPAEFMMRNSERIVGCHIKTFREKTTQVPLGQGDFGFEALAAAIKKTAWSGWLIDEEGGGKTMDSEAVGPDRQYIKRIFGV